ncbi:MAG: TraB/GumN family protein [Cyanobacteria bacterium J06621_11]
MFSFKGLSSKSFSLKSAVQTSLIAVGLPLAGIVAFTSVSQATPSKISGKTPDAISNESPNELIEQVSAQAVANPDGSNFLWSVETPTNTVYLLGSIHILSEADYPLAAPIQAAFEEAENVVFEVDLNALDPQEMLTLVSEKAAPDSEAERLQTALTPELYALAEEAAAEVNLPLAFFDDTEPWFFSLNIVVLKLMQLGFSGDYGVDKYLLTQAAETGKDIIALETLAEQLDIFDTLSIETQQTFGSPGLSMLK